MILKVCATRANVYITVPEKGKIENDSSVAASYEKSLLYEQ